MNYTSAAEFSENFKKKLKKNLNLEKIKTYLDTQFFENLSNKAKGEKDVLTTGVFVLQSIANQELNLKQHAWPRQAWKVGGARSRPSSIPHRLTRDEERGLPQALRSKVKLL